MQGSEIDPRVRGQFSLRARFKAAGISDVLIIVGYKAHMVSDYFGAHPPAKAKLSYVAQEKQDGTGSAARLKVETRDGKVLSKEILHRRGSPENPLKPGDIEYKFRNVARGCRPSVSLGASPLWQQPMT